MGDNPRKHLILVVKDGKLTSEAKPSLERRQQTNKELQALKDQIEELCEERSADLQRLQELRDFVNHILKAHPGDTELSETVKDLQKDLKKWQKWKQESSEQFYKVFRECFRSQDSAKTNETDATEEEA